MELTSCQTSFDSIFCPYSYRLNSGLYQVCLNLLLWWLTRSSSLLPAWPTRGSRLGSLSACVSPLLIVHSGLQEKAVPFTVGGIPLSPVKSSWEVSSPSAACHCGDSTYHNRLPLCILFMPVCPFTKLGILKTGDDITSVCLLDRLDAQIEELRSEKWKTWFSEITLSSEWVNNVSDMEWGGTTLTTRQLFQPPLYTTPSEELSHFLWKPPPYHSVVTDCSWRSVS